MGSKHIIGYFYMMSPDLTLLEQYGMGPWKQPHYSSNEKAKHLCAFYHIS